MSVQPSAQPGTVLPKYTSLNPYMNDANAAIAGTETSSAIPVTHLQKEFIPKNGLSRSPLADCFEKSESKTV